jgi:hypothetical protein
VVNWRRARVPTRPVHETSNRRAYELCGTTVSTNHTIKRREHCCRRPAKAAHTTGCEEEDGSRPAPMERDGASGL